MSDRWRKKVESAGGREKLRKRGRGEKDELVEFGREMMENSSGDRTSMISGGIELEEIARSRS